MKEDKLYKFCFVGDNGCGKHELIELFLTSLPGNEGKIYPGTFSGHVVEIQLDEKTFEVNLVEIISDEYERLRPLSYQGTDAFILCYEIPYWISFENVQQKWLPEIQHFCPGTPFIVVGTRSDRRKGNPDEETSYETGLNWANEVGAFSFTECSETSGENVGQVFRDAMKIALLPRKKVRKCLIV
ncbi:P-loop containing nucleoside triphosphate hydrolase protein [Sistotremastrum suecicum HHB10207 ss-3]|uniref:p-loop containing nucleoside triphosphate hydrolase protein n=1 Tax=Sistotremastrum suecicum HHB10207 ss-3 TaxID=1314776 RepID=A0A166J0L4_9AGAM|nr:P-loop containing nucleoside triphosphate hydrolase protein [Sistotremastrum suecicum HHB10207 ss-3]